MLDDASTTEISCQLRSSQPRTLLMVRKHLTISLTEQKLIHYSSFVWGTRNSQVRVWSAMQWKRFLGSLRAWIRSTKCCSRWLYSFRWDSLHWSRSLARIDDTWKGSSFAWQLIHSLQRHGSRTSFLRSFGWKLSNLVVMKHKNQILAIKNSWKQA